MRLYNFINEESDISVDKVREDCLPFIKEFSNTIRLFRGAKRKIEGDVEKRMPRDDRKPKDTPLVVQQALDDIFNKKFGWKPRSEGVFTSTDRAQTILYGTSYRFLPIGKYKYLYSEVISDLTDYLSDKNIIGYEGDYIPTTLATEDNLKGVVNLYTDKDLKGVYSTREVMWYCPKGYYLLSDKFVDNNYNKLWHGDK